MMPAVRRALARMSRVQPLISRMRHLFQLRETSRSETAAPAMPPLPELDTLLREADSLRDNNDPARAALVYAQALGTAPERDDICVQLGNMLKDSGQLAAAHAAYRQALTLSETADTHLQLGHLLKLTGHRREAVAEYRRALAIDPNLPGAIEELAEAGSEEHLERRFSAHQQAGGVETLLTLAQTVVDIRTELSRLSRLLPDIQSRAGFPLALWDTFRTAFPVPPPPDPAGIVFRVFLLADRESLTTVFAQIGVMQAQSHSRWVLDVLGNDPDRRRIAELAAVADRRIQWRGSTENEAALARAPANHHPADWILLLASGAMLDPHALAWFAQATAWSDAAAFVCDEEAGTREFDQLRRSSPMLRAAVDHDALLEANIYGETIAVRAAVFASVADELPDSSITAARTALLLHLSSRGQAGHVPLPLVWRDTPVRSSVSEHRDGVAAFLGRPDTSDFLDQRPGTSPVRQPQNPEAPIAVIIPTRDNAADLLDMVQSLLRTAAMPHAIQIVIADNGTERPEDKRILSGLENEGATLLRRDEPFNWSHLNNQAVLHTTAPLLVFANDDMRMVSPGWDGRLRELLERPDLGAVGARLLYADDTVQHAGVLFGWKGSVIHEGVDEPGGEAGPDSRLNLPRAVGAVTGAFLATTRRQFDSVGGFDARGLPVAYSDIDYALKLRAAGLRILWTPAITLYHHESKTRAPDHIDPWRAARNMAERRVMEARWGKAMNTDPSVHPFWQADAQPFRLLGMPSLHTLQAHIVRTGSGAPWTP